MRESEKLGAVTPPLHDGGTAGNGGAVDVALSSTGGASHKPVESPDASGLMGSTEAAGSLPAETADVSSHPLIRGTSAERTPTSASGSDRGGLPSHCAPVEAVGAASYSASLSNGESK